MQSSTVVLESQLDWLTLAVHTAEGTRRLERDATRWASNELAGGEKQRLFRLNGYEGWRAGRVRFGSRQVAGLIQLSGDLAERHFDALYPRRDNISRLDLAVTVRTPTPDGLLGSRHYAESSAFRAEHPKSARPSAILNSDGGWTTYLGDRSSDYYLRIYNKEAECREERDDAGADHYAACWRYELECKGPAATMVAGSVFSATDRPGLVQGYLHDYCSAHGLAPAFERSGGARLQPGFRRRSDRESRLLWLERSVKPALKWLFENGSRAEVLLALGLDEPPRVNPVLEPDVD